MSTLQTPFRYDFVGSFLRPEKLKQARRQFDDERSGGFAPLAKVSGDKKVLLGLITTKSPVLEDKQFVINRIHEAAQYIPLERLYLSPQCGFASCEIGNKLLTYLDRHRLLGYPLQPEYYTHILHFSVKLLVLICLQVVLLAQPSYIVVLHCSSSFVSAFNDDS